MTVVHNHPHPLTMQVVKPVNPHVFLKFGMVRVDDWDDRITGYTWDEQLNRPGSEAATRYWDLAQDPSVSENQKLGQQLPSQPYAQHIVRCHSLTTGELILLHDDWIR